MAEAELDILVPYWGPVGLLRETVESVLAQDDPRWRLTVVDDAYPDPEGGRWVQDLAARDPRVRYVRNQVNLGITATFRRCAELAEAAVVAIPGCDDVLEPNYVRVILAAHATEPTAAVIQPGVRVIDDAGVVVRPLGDRVKSSLLRPNGARLLRGEPLAASLLRGNWMYWPSLAFRRDVLVATPFRADLDLIQDLGLVMDMITAGESLLVVPDVCFRYRRHLGSASMTGLLEGTRFHGERAYFAQAARQVGTLGWRRARRAARWHLTSRLNALTLIPRALATRPSAVGMLLRHAFGPPA